MKRRQRSWAEEPGALQEGAVAEPSAAPEDGAAKLRVPWKCEATQINLAVIDHNRSDRALCSVTGLFNLFQCLVPAIGPQHDKVTPGKVSLSYPRPGAGFSIFRLQDSAGIFFRSPKAVQAFHASRPCKNSATVSSRFMPAPSDSPRLSPELLALAIGMAARL